jgi:hypothetical protein
VGKDTRSRFIPHLNKSTGDWDVKDVGVTGTGVGNITGAGLLCIESIELNLYTCVRSVLNAFNMSSVMDNQSLPIGLPIPSRWYT